MKAEETVKYSVIVPCFNEQENVPSLYVKIIEVMDALGEPYELIFMDDGSRDRTFKVLSEIYEHDRRVNLVRLRRNFGQTAALKAGFDYARGEIVVSMDGDLQSDPAEIPLFLEKMKEGYDIVSGWRTARSDNVLSRQIPSRVANWLMAKLSGVPIHDFGATYKAYRREVLQEVRLYGELHRFIPALASWSGARIAEVPIKHLPRKSGRSNYGLSRTIRVFLDLISVKFLLDYSTKPLHFFGLLGLAGTGLGGVIGLDLLYKKLVLGEPILLEHGPLILMAMVLILSGLQFLSIGLVSELVSRTYYESQNKPIYFVAEVRSHREEAIEEDVLGGDTWRP